MTEPGDRWSFGVEPLPQARIAAPLMRRVAGLVLALEREDPAVDRLIDALTAADAALSDQVDIDAPPRLGLDAPVHRRPYVDHARDIGAYDPCFPEYTIAVDGATAGGTVTFPVVFEGPPGIVHGGVLATFFDCVIQHHNCEVGVAGKTTSLLVEYRRPAPLGVGLEFRVERSVDEHRIHSRADLVHQGVTLCHATMHAVAGDRANLPVVSPRRPG